MACKSRMLRATVLAAPLSALALSAYAADIASTIQEEQQFSTLAKAMESAGMVESLQGEGPYTVFAPTDQAFEQLPQGALDELMKDENQDQLRSLLQYHVVEGEEIAAKDAIGSQTEVDTASGDRLSVDGTGQVVMLVPTGLKVTRVGDQVYVEREVTAITAPAVEVGPAGSDQQGQQSGQQAQRQGGASGASGEEQEASGAEWRQGEGSASREQQGDAQTEVAEDSGMPASEHQQEVLATEPATEERQTEAQGGDMPSSPHQEQVLRDEQTSEQQSGRQAAMTQPQTAEESDMPASPHQEQVLRGQQSDEQQGDAQTEVAEDSGMPASEHQQEVLATEPATQERQTEAQGGDMPSSPHQEQVLRDEQTSEQQSGRQAATAQPQTAEESDLPASPHQEQVLRGQQSGEQRQSAQAGQQDIGALRQANVVEPDIKADNGVIHAIDAVLIPQSVLSMIEQSGSQGRSGQSGTQPSGEKQS